MTVEAKRLPNQHLLFLDVFGALGPCRPLTFQEKHHEDLSEVLHLSLLVAYLSGPPLGALACIAVGSEGWTRQTTSQGTPKTQAPAA